MDNVVHAFRDRLSTVTASDFPVKATSLPRSFFRFPPSPEPRVLPIPDAHPLREYLFHIPPNVYNNLLSPNVPVTIALIYATVVTYMNSVNKDRKYKPWAISRTRLFKLFVILHNAFLAVYSAWTFVGMVSAVRSSMPPWSESGIAGKVDALCKINGPRGFGHAASYNETSRAWAFTNRALHFGADGLSPDVTDVGRIWNEGLAFYGWLFYLSKFYEVIDTAIILAKGKKSSFLQTYHHAGAMLCMWAGIRYMSPPIWMFVLVNSFIHTIMYTFYLCSVLSIKIPKPVKKALTTMQITQFVVGAIYAFAHLFVAYKAPVSVPYLYHFENVVASVASSFPSDVSAAASTATASATAGLSAWLKKAAFRAAGREGLAENVVNDRGRTFGLDTTNAARDLARRTETRYQDELHWTPCLDTSGQVFAIYLNCFYLLPLTGLFVRFFYKAYLKQLERRRSSTSVEKMQMARRSLSDASRGIRRQIKDSFDEAQLTNEEIGDDVAIIDEEELKREFQETKAKAQQKIDKGVARTKEEIAKIDTDKAKEKVAEGIQQTKQTVSEGVRKAQESVPQAARNAATKVSENTQKAGQTVSEAAQSAKENIPQASREAATKVSKGTQQVRENVSQGAQQAATKISENTQGLQQSVKQGAQQATDKVSEGAQKAKENAPKVDSERLKQEVANDLQKLKQSLDQGKSQTPPSSPSSKQSNKQKIATSNTSPDVKKQASDTAEAAKTKANEVAGEASKKAGEVSSKISETINNSDVKKQASDTAEVAKSKANEVGAEVNKKTGDASSKVSENVNTPELKKQASNTAEQAKAKASEVGAEANKAGEASSKISETAKSSDVKKQASNTAETAKSKANEAAGEGSKQGGEVASKISETSNQLLSSSTNTTESPSKPQPKSQTDSKTQPKSESKSSPNSSPRKAADHNKPGTTTLSSTVSSIDKGVSDDLDSFSREARELLREQEEDKPRSAQASPRKPSKLPQRPQSPTKKVQPQQQQEKKKSPNGAGTDGGEATGQKQPQLNLPTSEEEMKKMKEFKEDEEDRKEKKVEEKILKSSKPTRENDMK